MTAVASLGHQAVAGLQAPGRFRQETIWGLILLVPYLVMFSGFVVYPVLYGLWLGSSPAAYVRLWQDPVFISTMVNTVVFLGVAWIGREAGRERGCQYV